MDNLLNGLLSFGIGGMMAACMVWFLHHTVKVVLPGMAQDYRESLREQMSTFREAIGQITARLERLDANVAVTAQRLESLDSNTRANNEHLQVVRDWLARRGRG